MPLTLQQFVERVPNFRSQNDPAKVKLFVWFVHRAQSKDRVNTGDIRECYDALHLDRPNISDILSRLSDRRPAVLLKDSRGYYLEGGARASIDNEYLAVMVEQPIEVGDDVLPDALVKGTRPHIEALARQINGSYQYKFYDGCAVLMRRLIESLLIEAFAKSGHVQEIRNDGEFVMLDRIITVAKTGKFILLARGSDKILEDVKYIGDRSAHSRSYISTQNDIRDIINRFRTIIAELLHLAQITPTK